MSFEANFEEAAANEGTFDSGPIPEGPHDVTLFDVETEVNPFSEGMATTVVYEVKEGPHAKRRVWDKVQHKDGQEWKAAKIHRGLGLKGTPTSFEEWASACKEKKGMGFTIQIVHRKGADKTFANVQSVRPVDGVPF